jgi:hypothetical protein
MEVDMDSKPIYIRDSYKGSGKLQGKVAIITGGRVGWLEIVLLVGRVGDRASPCGLPRVGFVDAAK